MEVRSLLPAPILCGDGEIGKRSAEMCEIKYPLALVEQVMSARALKINKYLYKYLSILFRSGPLGVGA